MQIEVYCCWFVVSLCCEKNHLKQSVAPGQFSRCAKQVWPKIALEKIGGSEERRMKGFSYSVHAWYVYNLRVLRRAESTRHYVLGTGLGTCIKTEAKLKFYKEN
jgi:hypothetical protein